MSKYSCEYCGKGFQSSQKLAAHTRHHCDEAPAPTTTDQDTDTTADADARDQITDAADPDLYQGHTDDINIIDADTPGFQCGDCGSTVRPGTSCTDCGAQIPWKEV